MRNLVAKNTVPVTVVPHTLSHAPVVLSYRISHQSLPMISTTKPLSMESFASSCFSARHSCITWVLEGGWRRRMSLPPSWDKLALCSLAENLGTYLLLTSLDSGVPIWISWTSPYLDLLRWVKGILSFWRKDEAIFFRIIFSTPENASSKYNIFAYFLRF